MIFALLLAAPRASRAQDCNSGRIYRAYAGGDMDEWRDVISEMESVPDDACREKLVEYYYGYTGYLIGLERKTEAARCIERAEKLIAEWLADEPENPSALAFEGVFTAFRIPLNKIKAPVLGPRSMKLIKRAYRADADDVQALSAMGSMLYHAPAIFGGDREEGIRYIERAVRKIEESGGAAGDWYYLSLLVMLAQFTEVQRGPEAAAALYEKILAAEPGFTWVRDELYPQLKSKLN